MSIIFHCIIHVNETMILNKKRFIVLCHFCTLGREVSRCPGGDWEEYVHSERKREWDGPPTDWPGVRSEREGGERAGPDGSHGQHPRQGARVRGKRYRWKRNVIWWVKLYGLLSNLATKNFLRCVNVKIQEIIVKIQTVAETSSFQHIHDFFVIQKVFCIHGIWRNLYSLQLVIWFHNVQLQTLGCQIVSMRFMYFCCWWPVKYIWLVLY